MKSNKKDLAYLNALGLQRASDLLPTSSRTQRYTQTSALAAHYAVELTVGIHPEDLVREAVLKVRDQGLQTFLKKLVVESEVLPLLTQRINADGVYQRFAIQYLRAAGESVQYWSAMGRDEREVLYVATLVLGLQNLIAECVAGNATPKDVMFTIVRPHLYQLEEISPGCAALLRQCLGWGNEGEVDGEYLPRLQDAVERAVQSMSRPWRSRAGQIRRNARRLL